MRRDLNYNIHDLVRVRVNTSSKPILKGLNDLLSFFKVEDTSEHDIEINIGKFTPKNNNCKIIDHKYYVRDNYFYCRDSSGPGRWHVEIIGFEEPPVMINFHGKVRNLMRILAPDYLAQDIILYPFIELFLGFKGLFLAHAAGIAKDSECWIFVGRSGSLKTTLALEAFRAGYKILGEERVIFNAKNDFALSFPVSFGIFESLIELGTSEYLNLRQKMSIALRLMKQKKPIEGIWQDKPARVRALFFLKRRMFTSRKMTIRPIEKEIALKELMANNMAEMYVSDIPFVSKNFNNYLNVYSFVFSDSKICSYWEAVEEYLSSFVDGKDLYEVLLPEEGIDNQAIFEKLMLLI